MPTVIQFPEMLPGESPSQVRHFDPGLGLEPPEAYFLSPLLPMNPKEAGRALRRLEAMGDQYSAPGDLAPLKLGGLLPENREGFHDIKDELTDMEDPERAAEKKRGEAMVKAQTVLLLARSLQERAREMGRLERGVADTWERFGTSLGFEEGDREARNLAPADGRMEWRGGSGEAFAAWRGILRSMAAFLPDDAVLRVSMDFILDAWKEKGLLTDADAGPDQGESFSPPDGWRFFRVSLARLAGLESVPGNEPWLDRACGLLVPEAFLADAPQGGK